MFVAERMIQRYLIFPRWFSDRLQSARYALVPVCNLGTDALTTILDVVYARQLVHNRYMPVPYIYNNRLFYIIEREISFYFCF